MRARARELATADPDLARVLEVYGPPPMWGRAPTFGTLIHLILEQQVSLASARAAMDRLVERIGEPTPDGVLALDDDALLEIGFSRQKRTYARDLARRVRDGDLDLARLGDLDDADVRDELTAVKGIGAWTADIFLLMALGRPDSWPVGDRALVVAARALRGLETDPTVEEMEAIGDAWRPWRSVAARILWHFYLCEIRPPGGRQNRRKAATLTADQVS
ncbi:MAG: DNA-3-methyladenine glycosylase 2 family protein [Gemmatimonadetes bacterium]|nr:DNA-3-methyladenine glycosylase 2 family protein [Gemmatimonadota bacterium]